MILPSLARSFGAPFAGLSQAVSEAKGGLSTGLMGGRLRSEWVDERRADPLA